MSTLAIRKRRQTSASLRQMHAFRASNHSGRVLATLFLSNTTITVRWSRPVVSHAADLPIHAPHPEHIGITPKRRPRMQIGIQLPSCTTLVIQLHEWALTRRQPDPACDPRDGRAPTLACTKITHPPSGIPCRFTPSAVIQSLH